MGKKTAAGLLGTLITAGVAVGVAKYLKDYAGVSFTDDEQIDKVKSDSGAVKEAAKRTYIAIKEKSDFKEAAAELTKAAGTVVTDAADIARTAGNETVQAFKDMKSRYDENPEAFRSEVTDNLNDMTHNLVKTTQDKTEELVDRIKNAYNDFDVYEVENADAGDASDGVSSDAEDASDGASFDADSAEAASSDAEPEKASDDGSFKLNFVDDDNSDKGSNVTITDDAE